MAITNAQQYQQLVNKPANGKRPGYRGSDYGDQARGTGAYSGGPPGNTGGGSTDRSKTTSEQDRNTRETIARNQALNEIKREQEKKKNLTKFGYQKPKTFLNTLSQYSPLNIVTKPLTNFLNQKQIEMYVDNYSDKYDTYQDYLDAITSRFDNTDNGGGEGSNILLPQGIMAQAPNTTDQEPEVEEEDEIINYRLMADGGKADDGRIGFFKGAQADASAGKGAMSPGTDTGGGFRGGEGDGPKGPPTNVGGGGITNLTSKKDIPTFNTDFSKFSVKDLIDFGIINPEEENTQLAKVFGEQDLKNIGAVEKGFFGNKLTDQGKALEAFRNSATNFKNAPANTNNTAQSALNFMGNKPGLYGDIIENKDFIQNAIKQGFLQTDDDYINQKPLDTFSTGGRAALAEGGMPYEGGIMDLETSRQMYGLGKLVKKITRGVKKIAKSPIGKAALIGGLGYLGATKMGGMKGLTNFFGKGSLNPFKVMTAAGKVSSPFGALASKFGMTDLITGNLTGMGKGALYAGIPTALSYLMTPKEEDEDETLYPGADIDDPRFIMANPSKYTNPRLMAEGGSTEEPVAKKTMPLLDMDGQEMDLRAEGGFVPLGRMERADDVPARLSKNEFVFTADAVRNAGEGDVDKGAEVMYNMMKNLESGGEVSEESQGLEGARDMFQTSQRLEEVI